MCNEVVAGAWASGSSVGAFGEAVIDIANDPAYDQWTFSQKIRHALDHESAARTAEDVKQSETRVVTRSV